MELSILSEALRKQAVILSGEAAWPKETARGVIDFLLRNGYAVLGIELWVPEGGVPRVVGWSDYDVVSSGDWDEYVQLNAQHAIQELEKMAPEGSLYNLTWISRDEFKVN